MNPLSTLMSHRDPAVAQSAAEFDAAFTRTLELMRAELAENEPATMRRVVDRGYAMERAALLVILGYCNKFVVKLTSHDDEGALAWDARATAFLKSLLAGEPLSVETLRPLPPVLEDTAEQDLAVFNAEDHNQAPQLADHREAP